MPSKPKGSSKVDEILNKSKDKIRKGMKPLPPPKKGKKGNQRGR